MVRKKTIYYIEQRCEPPLGNFIYDLSHDEVYLDGRMGYR